MSHRPMTNTSSLKIAAAYWMGSITVCPVHIFTPPTELLVCYQPHRQEFMPGQKSIYETFLVRNDNMDQYKTGQNYLH